MGVVGGSVHSLLLGVTIYLVGCLLKICWLCAHLLCIKDFTTLLHLSLSYFHFQATFSSATSSSFFFFLLPLSCCQLFLLFFFFIL